jgi:hypothetical protein
LFKIANQAKIDPTTRFGEFSDGRSYGVLYCSAPYLTLGDTIINYASMRERICPSLYEVFLDYEGLLESTRSDTRPLNLLTAMIAKPSLVQGKYAKNSVVYLESY